MPFVPFGQESPTSSSLPITPSSKRSSSSPLLNSVKGFQPSSDTSSASSSVADEAPSSGGIFSSLVSKVISRVSPSTDVMLNAAKNRPEFLKNVGDNLQKRGADIQENFITAQESRNEPNIFKKGLTPFRSAGHTVGSLIGGFTDVIAGALESGAKSVFETLPKDQQEYVKQRGGEALTAALSIPIVKGKTTADYISKFTSAWNDWESKNKEAAKDIKSVVNVLSVLPIGEAEAVVARGTKAALGETAVSLKSGAKALERSVVEKAGQEAVTKAGKLEKYLIPEMTKAEKEAAVKSGKITVGSGGEVILNPGSKEATRAQVLQDIVDPDKLYAENLNAVKADLENQRAVVRKGLQESPGTYSVNNLKGELAKKRAASETQSVLYSGDRNKAYDAVQNQFFAILDKHPRTYEGLWDARIEFDSWVSKMKGDRFWEGEAKSSYEKAVEDMRDSANEFIIANAKNGKLYEEGMKRMSAELGTIDDVLAPGVAKELGTKSWQRTLNTVTDSIKKNPALATLSAFGIGGALSTILGIISSPIAITALSVGGMYKVGKTVLTSGQLRLVLAKALEGAATAIEKSSIQKVLDLMSEASVLSGKAGAVKALEDKNKELK